MHSGRRLAFQPNMGTADLRATFGAGRRHELNVSTYQMCVLLLFNETDSMSYRDIAQVRVGQGGRGWGRCVWRLRIAL